MDGQCARAVNVLMDGWMDGQCARAANGWMDRWPMGQSGQCANGWPMGQRGLHGQSGQCARAVKGQDSMVGMKVQHGWHGKGLDDKAYCGTHV